MPVLNAMLVNFRVVIFTNFGHIYFICNDKCLSDNSKYNEDVVEQCEMNCANLIERIKSESDRSSQIYEASCRFNILCNR